MDPGEGGKKRSIVALQVIQCIEKALSRFGESTPAIVFWNFESVFKVHKDEILSYPDEFVLSLEKMFGVGSKLIESVLLGEINSSFHELVADKDSQDLTTALKQVRAYDQRMRDN
jgi:hypothetical protein